jgi:tetratricopeptide (TPR) repeat protein
LAAVWGAGEILKDHPKLAGAVGVAAVLACAVASWSHTHVWRDSIRLMSDALTVTADNSMVQHHLAAALEDGGRFDEALPHHAEAVRIEPSYFVAQCSYGLALERRGENAQAAEHFSEAIRYFPNYADAHFHLGLTLDRLGRNAEAKAELKRAIEIGLPARDAAEARRKLQTISMQSP